MPRRRWRKSKRAYGANASFSKKVPSMLLQNIVVPKHQNVIDAVEQKIRRIDKYRERNRKINRISKQSCKAFKPFGEKAATRNICILLIMKQEDFLSMKQFKKKLGLILHYKKTEFSNYSQQLYRLGKQRQATRKNIVTTVKAISNLRQQMRDKRIVFETQLNTLLAQLECDRLASQLHEVSFSKNFKRD